MSDKSYKAIKLPLILIGLSLLIRLIWIFSLDYYPCSDANAYYEGAMGLAQGEGYLLEGKPSAYWPVGYPGFLAGMFKLFGAGVLAGQLANAALAVGTMILTYRLALLMFSSRTIANAALALTALNPNQVFYSAVLMSEPLFQFLLLTIVFLWSKAARLGEFARGESHRLMAVSGVVLGLAVYVRPAAVLLPVVMALLWLIRKKSPVNILRHSVIIYALALMMIAPWIYRNYRLWGKFTLISTNGGVNLYIGNNPDAAGGYPDTLDFSFLPERHEGLTEAELDALFYREALNYITAHPVKTLRNCFNKFYYMWYSDADGFSMSVKSVFDRVDAVSPPVFTKTEWAVKWGMQVLYVSILLLFAFSLFRLKRESIDCLLYILLFTLVSMVFFGNPRYHFPLMPLVAVYAAQGLMILSEGTKQWRRLRIE